MAPQWLPLAFADPAIQLSCLPTKMSLWLHLAGSRSAPVVQLAVGRKPQAWVAARSLHGGAASLAGKEGGRRRAGREASSEPQSG